jgi:phosphoglycolate phosphatase
MSVAGRYTLLTIDLDGTLVDTAAEIAEAANRSIEEFGLPRQSVAMITRLIGAGTRELMLKLLNRVAVERGLSLSPADREAVLARFDVHYEATAGTACHPYPHVADALSRLRHAGVRLACVTNKETRYSELVLAACGLSTAFDLLVGGDTLAVKKPDARVLGHAIDVLGATRLTTAHVGDSRTDVEAARNAGVAAWVVPYGYNGGVPVETAQPDRMFADLGEVARHVLD